jgi:hypothetical protein
MKTTPAARRPLPEASLLMTIFPAGLWSTTSSSVSSIRPAGTHAVRRPPGISTQIATSPVYQTSVAICPSASLAMVTSIGRATSSAT